MLAFLFSFSISDCSGCTNNQICCDDKCLSANKSVFCCDSVICNTKCNGILNFRTTDLNTNGFCLNQEDFSYYQNPLNLLRYILKFTFPTLVSIVICIFYGSKLSNKVVYIRSLVINVSIGIFYFGYTKRDILLAFIGALVFLIVQGYFTYITFGHSKNYFLQSELKLAYTLSGMESVTYQEFLDFIKNEYTKPPPSSSPYQSWKNARNKLSLTKGGYSVVVYHSTVTDFQNKNTESLKKNVFLINDFKGKQLLSELDVPFWIASNIFGLNVLFEAYICVRSRVHLYENSRLISSEKNLLFKPDEDDTSFNGTIEVLKP